MPAWIAAALRLIAQGAGFGAGAAAATEFFEDPFTGAPTGLGAIGRGPGRVTDALGNIIGRAGGRRRRRRRALTASDRADIAFIAGMISKAAAKDFAVQLAARPR